jgi:transcriptional regulator with PAS, ATPase and Fis domain
VTIAASWRTGTDTLRPDLVSRISDRVIFVPGVTARGDDAIALINALQTDLINGYRSQMEELGRKSGVDRYWAERARALRQVSPEVVERLAEVDWETFGNMRGLTVALRRILFANRSLEDVLSELEPIESSRQEDSLVGKLFQRRADGSGLANQLREVERQERTKLREILTSDLAIRDRLFRHLGLDPKKVSHQIQQLDRSRKRK